MSSVKGKALIGQGLHTVAGLLNSRWGSLPVNQVVVGATPVSSRVAAVASGEALVSLADRASMTKSLFELVADAVLSAVQTPATASPTSAT